MWFWNNCNPSLVPPWGPMWVRGIDKFISGCNTCCFSDPPYFRLKVILVSHLEWDKGGPPNWEWTITHLVNDLGQVK